MDIYTHFCDRAIRLTSLLLASLAAGSSVFALDDPSLSGSSAFAGWDTFTDAGGGPNTPETSSLGFTDLPELRQVASTSGAFIASSGNIYSFSGPTSFRIEGTFGGLLDNLVLQFSTSGRQADYGSIRASYGPDFSFELEPTSQAISNSDTSQGFTEISYLAQWDFSMFGGVSTAFQISFDASGSSMSLTEARVDVSDTFNDVAPPAPIIQNEPAVLAYAGSDFSLTIASTGEPFIFFAETLPLWLSVNNATGEISGTIPPDTSGIFPIIVSVSNGQESGPFNIQLFVEIPTTYATWISEAGATGSDALTSADPDGDGLVNLEEYFYGTQPRVSDAEMAGRQLSIIQEVGSPDQLVLSFNWNLQAVDMIAELQSSDASFNWLTNQPEASLKFSVDGTATASLITEETDTGFLRLTLTRSL